MSLPKTLTLEIAGRAIIADLVEGASPYVVMLGGYAGKRLSVKAQGLLEHCAAAGRGFVRFDYSGHGDSPGDFLSATFDDKLLEALYVIDNLTPGPVVLAGSSMGGWLAIAVARLRPQKIAGIVTIACAADFTQDVLLPALTTAQLEELASGVVYISTGLDPEPTPFSRLFVDSAKKHLILPGPIPLDCPIHLIHGLDDATIPWRTSVAVAEAVTTPQARVELLKGGGHRLSEPREVELLVRRVEEMANMA